MKKSLLIALFAAMPLMAQEAPQKPECAPQRPCCKRMMNCPKLTDEQKAEMKAKFEARRAEMKAKFMEKFDTDKDGKISDAEKEAIKAEFAKRGPKGPRFHGKRGGKRHGFGPKGPRPELTDEQKAEMKAKFEARRAEMIAKYDADKDGKLSEEERKAAREARRAERHAKFMEKFDTDKDGKISDAEKEAIKAEFGKRGPRHHRRGPKGPRPCCPKAEQN